MLQLSAKEVGRGDAQLVLRVLLGNLGNKEVLDSLVDLGHKLLISAYFVSVSTHVDRVGLLVLAGSRVEALSLAITDHLARLKSATNCDV
jgi:hypothetical protein